MSVAIIVIVGMRPSHVLRDGIGGERGQATTVMARSVHVVSRSGEAHVVVPLDLRGCSRQQIDVHTGQGAL